jgi:hypothetical protein
VRAFSAADWWEDCGGHPCDGGPPPATVECLAPLLCAQCGLHFAFMFAHAGLVFWDCCWICVRAFQVRAPEQQLAQRQVPQHGVRTAIASVSGWDCGLHLGLLRLFGSMPSCMPFLRRLSGLVVGVRRAALLRCCSLVPVAVVCVALVAPGELCAGSLVCVHAPAFVTVFLGLVWGIAVCVLLRQEPPLVKQPALRHHPQ